jgi:hypothetical protein
MNRHPAALRQFGAENADTAMINAQKIWHNLAST